jgi:hypothetical protein
MTIKIAWFLKELKKAIPAIDFGDLHSGCTQIELQ